MSGHPVIPVIPYVPSGGPKFISFYDPRTGGIMSDEVLQCDAYIHAWASANKLNKAANMYFNPPASSGNVPASPVLQIGGLQSFFDISPELEATMNLATASVFFLQSWFQEAINSSQTPVRGQIRGPIKTNGTNAGDSYPVLWTDEGSVFKWRLDGFQRLLNKGGW